MSETGVLAGKRVAILVEDEFDDRELVGPLEALREAGATVTIVGPAAGTEYRGKHGQAVVSSNRALLNALHGYFLYRQSPGRDVSEVSASSAQPRDIDWMDWEARKQRHLRSVSNGNRVA